MNKNYTPEHIILTPESLEKVRSSIELSTIVIPYFDNLLGLSLGIKNSNGEKIANSNAEKAWINLWNLEKGKITIAYPPAIQGAPKTISRTEGFDMYIKQSRGSFKKMIFYNTQVYKASDNSTYFINCDGDMESDTPETIPYKNHYLFIVKIEEGKIIEVTEYFDPIAFGDFLNQLFSQVQK